MKKIDITSGDCLNRILQEKDPARVWIPFREAMIKGTYASDLFSDGFIAERSRTHGVTEEEYREKLSCFLDVLRGADAYEEIGLWFGEEPFCTENRKVVIRALKESGFHGAILSHTVNEETGEILFTETLFCGESDSAGVAEKGE